MTTPTPRIRLPNMKSFEDEILCQTYVKVSTNSIVGNSQSGYSFWTIIQNEYNAHRNIIIQCLGGSLQTRYSTISQAVMAWASSIAQVYATQQESGTNEMNWMNFVRDEYQRTQGKPFLFDRCYQILKELPKFDISTTRMNAPHIFSDGNESSSPATPTTPMGAINLSDGSPIDIEEPSDRPDGRKAAKLRQRKKARASSLSANMAYVEGVEKFTDEYTKNATEKRESRMRFETQMGELIQIRKDEMEMKKNEMKMKKYELEMKLRQEEDLLMCTDISNMSEQQQIYYQMRFAEIMRRRQQGAPAYPGSSSSHM